MDTRKPNGLVVSALSSGSGKTAVTCLLLAALEERGLRLQPFKVGPDFIDPQYHSGVSRVPSRNLDLVLMGESGVRDEVSRYLGGRIGLVEGVMGLFDGADADSDYGSTYEMSRVLGWPVILVLDAAKAGRSVAVMAEAVSDRLGRERVAGVVLNRVRGASHAAYLREAFAASEVTLLGILGEEASLAWTEGDLGLGLGRDRPAADRSVLARTAEGSLDVGTIAACVETAPTGERPPSASRHPTCRLAIASDEGFRFYYRSCLDFLEEQGAELKPFSPLRDEALPEGIDGLIIGGGFPESYAGQIASNGRLRKEVGDAIRAGMPCYAECGGLMLLAEAVRLRNGERHPMYGVVPGTTELTDRLQHFGYCECYERESTDTEAPAYRGHEFHYSRWLDEGERANLWFVRRRRSGQGRWEGYTTGNLHASYVHLYFAAYPKLFARLFPIRSETKSGKEIEC